VLAESAIIARIEAETVGQAERDRRTCIGAIAAFADTGDGDRLEAEDADGDRAEILEKLSTNLP
jgi:hypothetical protein